MAFNYTNLGHQGLENMMPFFNTLANGASMPPHANFMNHLAAAMNNTPTTHASATLHNTLPTTPAAASTSNFNATKTATKTSRRNPEPPPPPRLRSPSPTRNNVKPNQGTAPMDLENDLENDTPTVVATTTNTVGAQSDSTPKLNTDKMPLNMPDSSLYLNGLMAGQICANPGFMFFPPNPAAGTAAANSLMDPATMMAAMQQMQQYGAYANGALADPSNTMDPNKMGHTNIAENFNGSPVATKEVIKTKSCMLLPPNPNAPPPTIRDRPPGCRTVFVGGLPDIITEEIVREIFESCGEISTLRMSKKNFCHIRFRHEESIDRAIYFSGYRVRLNNTNDQASFGRLHIDYAQARDDQYDYECKQRQLQREQRHRERMSLDRLRSQSPPPIPHYTDHEASMVAESLRNNDTFVKAVQTITIWLERGDCTKRNANVFYSMIQSTHAHVRRLTGDKQQLEEDLRKARESFRKQMLTMTAQFTQIEKVFNAASHKKVWDHFTKAQRKNIDQWKKLATELRSIQIEDDEMEMSDEDRDYQTTTHTKRKRYDSDNLKEENDSLRHQLEAMRNEMSLERTDLKYNSDFREKQMKVLQETIRNMQTQLLQTKMREQKDAKTIEQLEKRLKEAGVKQLLLKTKIRETNEKLKDREACASVYSESSEIQDLDEEVVMQTPSKKLDNSQIIDIDVDKSDDEVKIIEDINEVEEIRQKYKEKEKLKEQKDKEEKERSSIFEVTTTDDKHTEIELVQELDQQQKVKEKSCEVTTADEKDPQEKSLITAKEPLNQDEAKLIALTTAYLLIQPLGSTSQSICDYIKTITKDSHIQATDLNKILQKYTNIFETTVHIEDSMEFGDHQKIIWKSCALTV
ncbi:ecto-NOX disulfide-thiol exchanger 2 [Lucilia cuprina]|uniref:ecto-NOX disulfide-thiol exchanger 2 n=1 Tax=Lucilia cuprina TaxID=7375 RepID=UPI001F06AD02|nr:ecto-NOX disulfide-thiol exchanger 2 [Lucilia cuprina]